MTLCPCMLSFQCLSAVIFWGRCPKWDLYCSRQRLLNALTSSHPHRTHNSAALMHLTTALQFHIALFQWLIYCSGVSLSTTALYLYTLVLYSINAMYYWMVNFHSTTELHNCFNPLPLPCQCTLHLVYALGNFSQHMITLPQHAPRHSSSDFIGHQDFGKIFLWKT